jgi:hypothetical protein
MLAVAALLASPVVPASAGDLLGDLLGNKEEKPEAPATGKKKGGLSGVLDSLDSGDGGMVDNLLGNSSGGLSLGEMDAGLREALRVGTETVVSQLGVRNGFNLDPDIHIPLPDTLRRVKEALSLVGMSSLVDDLELKLNRAAEIATPEAKALFFNAIDSMTVDDARGIIEGPDDSATQYFRGKMSNPLAGKMRPIVDDALRDAGAVQAYDRMMGEYADLPFVPDVKADLVQHVLDLGIDGIFHYVAIEEAAIRNDPVKRTTEILQRVFGG